MKAPLDSGSWKIKVTVGLCLTIIVWLFCTYPRFSLAQDTLLWQTLDSGESIALMRHALAPGTGDPAAFDLNNCSTQRNLSSEGRDQASRIGQRFRDNGIHSAKVFSSQWCRCLETANLLELGQVQKLSILNSFFKQHENRKIQTQALREWIAVQQLDEPLVLITHQVNITALTGVYPASGEIVIVKRSRNGEIKMTATITTD